MNEKQTNNILSHIRTHIHKHRDKQTITTNAHETDNKNTQKFEIDLRMKNEESQKEIEKKENHIRVRRPIMIRLEVNFKTELTSEKKHQNPNAKRFVQATRIESEKTTTSMLNACLQ